MAKQGEQLSLNFDTHSAGEIWSVRVFGSNASLSLVSGKKSIERSLDSVGVHYRVDAGPPSAIVVPVFLLKEILSLPDGVSSPDDCKNFLRLFSFDTTVSALQMVADPSGDLRFSHTDTSQPLDVSISLASAVLGSDLRISAAPATWEWVKSSSKVPVTLARVEPLNGSFSKMVSRRYDALGLDLTSDGVRTGLQDIVLPNSTARRLLKEQGVIGPELNFASLPEQLSLEASYIEADASSIADRILTNSAAVVCYSPKLSVETALAHAVSLLPKKTSVLISTDPSALLAWRRAFQMYGINPFSDSSPVSLTYNGQMSNSATTGQQFDVCVADTTHQKAADRTAYAFDAFSAADPNTTAKRVVLTKLLPVTLAEQVALLEVVSPAVSEFLPQASEGFPASYLSEISVARPHVSLKSASESLLTANVVTSVVRPGADVSGAVQMALQSGASADKVLELATVGTDYVISPKIVEACQLATVEANSGAEVVIFTRFKKAAALLRKALPLPTERGSVTVSVFNKYPRLPKTATVIVLLDYPISMESLFASSKKAGSQLRMVVIHAALPIEDRLAELSASNDEKGVGYPLTPDEEEWLLS